VQQGFREVHSHSPETRPQLGFSAFLSECHRAGCQGRSCRPPARRIRGPRPRYPLILGIIGSTHQVRAGESVPVRTCGQTRKSKMRLPAPPYFGRREVQLPSGENNGVTFYESVQRLSRRDRKNLEYPDLRSHSNFFRSFVLCFY